MPQLYTLQDCTSDSQSPQDYTEASAEQVLQAARDIIDLRVKRGDSFRCPEQAADYLTIKLGGLEHEVFAALFLDSKNQLIEYVVLFRGTIDNAYVYVREVVKEALSRNAAAVIIAHNHPSGVPEPSAPDLHMTRRVKDALALVDVMVLDHIVIGGLNTVSFAERGLL